jgi:hypothetical protein
MPEQDFVQVSKSAIRKPHGFAGLLCDYFYSEAYRQVPEVALCSTIGLMSAMSGRAYNTPTGAGLNTYTVLIAPTGIGKEAMSTGIHSLIEQVALASPAIKTFIGPSRIASAPA